MRFTLIIVISLLCFTCYAQVGIGTNNPEGALDVVSNTSGLIVSRVDTIGDISAPINGMVVYDISTACIRAFEDGAWTDCWTQAKITALQCGSATHSGALETDSAATGVTTTIDYTGGNGLGYDAQTVSSVGVMGLSASLDSGVLALGSGSLVYSISGTPTSTGTALFMVQIGGQACLFSREVVLGQQPAAFSVPGCSPVYSPDTNGYIIIGEPFSELTLSVPYIDGNGGYYPAQIFEQIQGQDVVLRVPAGAVNEGAGTLELVIDGGLIPALTTSTTAFYHYFFWKVNIGGDECRIRTLVYGQKGAFEGMEFVSDTCNLQAGIAAGGCEFTVNGLNFTRNGYLGIDYLATHNHGVQGEFLPVKFNSRGVTGLTATYSSDHGWPPLGSDDWRKFKITGVPSHSGTAYFDIVLGGVSLTVSLVVS